MSIQLLSELEEIILCLTAPDIKQQLQKTWWNRLLVCEMLILAHMQEMSISLSLFSGSTQYTCDNIICLFNCRVVRGM